jgi:hypothetical protein
LHNISTVNNKEKQGNVQCAGTQERISSLSSGSLGSKIKLRDREGLEYSKRIRMCQNQNIKEMSIILSTVKVKYCLRKKSQDFL